MNQKFIRNVVAAFGVKVNRTRNGRFIFTRLLNKSKDGKTAESIEVSATFRSEDAAFIGAHKFYKLRTS